MPVFDKMVGAFLADEFNDSRIQVAFQLLLFTAHFPPIPARGIRQFDISKTRSLQNRPVVFDRVHQHS